jgi:hypothetical protein
VPGSPGGGLCIIRGPADLLLAEDPAIATQPEADIWGSNPQFVTYRLPQAIPLNDHHTNAANMAKQGKPEGNKKQRERDKRRKKEEKAARRLANTGGQPGAGTVDADGEPEDGETSATDLPVELDVNDDEPSPPSESTDSNARLEP